MFPLFFSDIYPVDFWHHELLPNHMQNSTAVPKALYRLYLTVWRPGSAPIETILTDRNGEFGDPDALKAGMDSENAPKLITALPCTTARKAA